MGTKAPNIQNFRTLDIQHVDHDIIMISMDVAGVVVEANCNFYRIFECSSDELIGKNLSCLSAGFHSQSFFADMWSTLQAGYSWKGDIKNKTQSGTIVWLAMTITPLKNTKDVIVGYQAVSFDITKYKELEEQQALIHNTIQAGVYTFRRDPDGSYSMVVCTQAFERIYEVETTKILEDVGILFKRVHPEDYQRLVESIEDSARRLEPWAAQFQIIMDDGQVKLVYGHSVPRQMDRGVIEWHGFIYDISETRAELMRQMERSSELKIKSDRLTQEWAQLIDTANAPIFGVDSGGNIVEWNQKIASLMGYHKYTVLGASLQTYVREDYQKKVATVIEHALQGKETSNYEIVLKTCTGRNLVLLMNATTRRSVDGLVVGVIGVAQDITRESIESKLRTTLNELMATNDIHASIEAIFNHASQYWSQCHMYVLQVDANKLNFLGAMASVPQEYCDGLYALPIGDGKGCYGTAAARNALVVTEDVQAHELWTNSRDIAAQHNIETCWSMPIVNPSNAVIGVFGCYFNHTVCIEDTDKEMLRLISNLLGIAMTFYRNQEREKELQSKLLNAPELLQSQKMEMIGRLAGGVAHDFNNALGVIHPMVQLLAQKTTDSELLDPYKLIQDSSEQARNVVKQLLQFARQPALIKQSIRLKPMIENLSYMIQKLLGKSHQFEFNCTDDTVAVSGDLTQLTQVVLNMVANAKDAMDNSGVLTISINKKFIDQHLSLASGWYVQLDISDTGRGVDPSILDTIYTPFFTTKPSGTGLGLSVSHGVIQAHNGHIDCISRRGMGTCFSIYLPEDVSSFSLKPKTGVSHLIDGKNNSLLLIEDDCYVREANIKIFSSLSYRVEGVSSVEEGLERYREKFHDLVVVDFQLGTGLNGIDGIKILKKMNPNASCILYTGDLYAESLQTFSIDSGVPVLYKPFDLQEISDCLKEIEPELSS